MVFAVDGCRRRKSREKRDAAVVVVWIGAERRVAGNLVVWRSRGQELPWIDQDAQWAPPVFGLTVCLIVEADIGDGVVVDRPRSAGEEGAGRADLHAVLGLERRLGADDLVVVDVDGQPRAVGEDAGLLEIADGRILDLDMVGVSRAVAGYDEPRGALGCRRFRLRQLAHIGDRDGRRCRRRS